MRERYLLVFQLESKAKPVATQPVATQPTEQQHVMLSYNWSHKLEVLEVRKALGENSLPVWIDVESMGENIVDGMVAAVGGAAVVVIFVSQYYMRSAHCRYEAEYAIVTLKKPIIFVLIEEGYTPEGWLALLMGSSLYLDLPQLSSRVSQISKRPSKPLPEKLPPKGTLKLRPRSCQFRCQHPRTLKHLPRSCPVREIYRKSNPTP